MKALRSELFILLFIDNCVSNILLLDIVKSCSILISMEVSGSHSFDERLLQMD
jgi:hypothetical protein